MEKFDVTIWGATGFTGGLCVEYFARVLSRRLPNLKWSIAGRNHTKLQATLASVQSLLPDTPSGHPGVLVGSIDDQASIDTIARQSRVILSTAGPFLKYGLPIVDACVRFGCHYTDITGETPFVRKLIDRYHDVAMEQKLIIMPMCGFDSIPSDLGAFCTARALATDSKSCAAEVRGFFTSNGGPSGGTLSSGQNMMRTPDIKAQFDQPFLLGGAHVGSGRVEDADISDAAFNECLGAWTTPFGMAQINTRVVRRSTELNPSLYSPSFSYNEMAVAPNEKVARKMASPPPPEVIQKLIDSGRLPKPGSGPSAEQRAKTFFGALFIGRAENGDEALLSFKGGDPGYTETSKMVSEAAICLAFDVGDPRRLQRFGVLTPSTGMGQVLLDKLAAVGLQFQQLPLQGKRVTAQDAGMALMSFLPSKL